MSRVFRNLLFNLTGQALIALLGFWGTRLVFHQLGDESLGILYFALALNTVLTPLIDLGVSATVVREVARHRNTDQEYVVRLSRTGTLFYWCSYALLAVAIWLTAPWLVSRWIHLKTLDPAVAVRALRFLAMALLLILPRSLYSNLLRGIERMEFTNLIEVGTIAVQQGGTIVVLMCGGGLVEITYCYLASFVLSNIIYILTVARLFSWRAILPGFFGDVIWQNLSFMFHMGAYTLLAVIQMETDKVLLSKLVAVGLLGFYGVAHTMVSRVSRIPGAAYTAAFPNLSALFQDRDRAGFMRQYRRLQDLVCYGMVPIFAGVIFAARPLFTYLLDARAARILLLPTALLCLGWYMNGTLNMPAAVSLAADRPDIGAKQNLYALFIVTPVTALLIWKWSLVGAGLSLVLYHFYAYSYGARRVAGECLGIRPQEWYAHVAKAVALAGATYGLAWGILEATSHGSIIMLICGYLAGTAAFLAVAYVSVGEELREGLTTWRRRTAATSLGSLA
jgi:O-antigen/teichoic acid export membrane protein